MSAVVYLAEAMCHLLEERETGDYSLVCGGRTIRAHSWVLTMRSSSTFVLAALSINTFGNESSYCTELSFRSPFFKGALSVPMVEKEAMRMEVKETSPETLSMAVDFMYGKEIVKGFGDCAGLLELAERFQMADLKKEASERLARIIDQNNYLVMCGLAQKFNAKVLAEGCAKYLLYTTVNVKWDKISKKMPAAT